MARREVVVTFRESVFAVPVYLARLSRRLERDVNVAFGAPKKANRPSSQRHVDARARRPRSAKMTPCVLPGSLA